MAQALFQMLTVRCPLPLKEQIDSFVASANEARDPYSPPVTMNSFVIGAIGQALNPDGGAPAAQRGKTEKAPRKRSK